MLPRLCYGGSGQGRQRWDLGEASHLELRSSLPVVKKTLTWVACPGVACLWWFLQTVPSPLLVGYLARVEKKQLCGDWVCRRLILQASDSLAFSGVEATGY